VPPIPLPTEANDAKASPIKIDLDDNNDFIEDEILDTEKAEE
jgi:hypothetical protein